MLLYREQGASDKAVTLAVAKLGMYLFPGRCRSRMLVLGEQEVSGVAVTLVADRFGHGTTSDGSGGLWEPYKLGDTPAELINKWGAETYEHLQVGGLTLAPHAPCLGCAVVFVCCTAPRAPHRGRKRPPH